MIEDPISKLAKLLGISYPDANDIIVERFVDEFESDPSYDDACDNSYPIGRLNAYLESLGLPLVGTDFHFRD